MENEKKVFYLLCLASINSEGFGFFFCHRCQKAQTEQRLDPAWDGLMPRIWFYEVGSVSQWLG